MKRILFRGKSEKDENWVYGYYVKDKIGREKIIDKDGNIHEIIPHTAGQYTGLKDKNNKKIFEGDIIRYGNYFSFTVIYNYTSFKLEEIEKRFCDEMSLYYHRIPKDFKIIGNIY